ncbi:MAG: HEPN domain-containing protein [Nostoc sp.]|uniref:ApeA N-terminal domain 1-containing protein n=1 Tax=Nostoc sp. TaxID=1180 RepID=UPI002FF8485E
MKEFEYFGFWWIPSNPQYKLDGQINYSHEEGITLKINGVFSKNMQTQEIILGESENKQFTLLNCFVTSQEFLFFDNVTFRQEYSATNLFIGYHFTHLKDIKFSKFQAGFTYLNDLLQLVNAKGKISIANKFSANIEIIQLDDIQSHNPNYIQQEYLGKITLLEMEFPEACILNEILYKFVNPLRYFITLITDKPNDITELYLWLPKQFAQQHRIEAIFSTIKMAREKEALSSYEFFLDLNELKQHFRLVIQKWFNLNDEIDDILNLYFNAYYNNDVYIQNKFLSIVQTLESYHRRKFDHKVSNTEKHQKRLQEILDSVSEKHKQWLEEKLRFSYEPSLEDRLNKLFHLTYQTSSQIIINSQSLVNKIKNNRNYLTHYDKSYRAKAASSQDLFKITLLLNFILKDCLLYELGISDACRKELISRHPVYKYIKDNLNEFNVV